MAVILAVTGRKRQGDNFAATFREPPEPTIDSEDFDERLRAAVAERLDELHEDLYYIYIYIYILLHIYIYII